MYVNRRYHKLYYYYYYTQRDRSRIGVELGTKMSHFGDQKMMMMMMMKDELTLAWR